MFNKKPPFTLPYTRPFKTREKKKKLRQECWSEEIIICEKNTKTSYKKTNNAGKDILGTQLCGTEEGQLGLAKLGAAVDGRSGKGHLHNVGHTDPLLRKPPQGLPHSEADDKLELPQT